MRLLGAIAGNRCVERKMRVHGWTANSRHEQFGTSRETEHIHLVLAIALGCWLCNRKCRLSHLRCLRLARVHAANCALTVLAGSLAQNTGNPQYDQSIASSLVREICGSPIRSNGRWK